MSILPEYAGSGHLAWPTQQWQCIHTVDYAGMSCGQKEVASCYQYSILTVCGQKSFQWFSTSYVASCALILNLSALAHNRY